MAELHQPARAADIGMQLVEFFRPRVIWGNEGIGERRHVVHRMNADKF